MRFLDTNAVLLGRLEDEEFFAISSVTLEELESIKTNKNKTDEIKWRARKAVRWLNENQDKYMVVLYTTVCEELILANNLEITPDTKIIASAVMNEKDFPNSPDNKIVFVTEDLCCKLIAKNIFGLMVGSVFCEEEIFKGYKLIRGNTELINQALSSTEDWSINEYAIIQNIDDDSETEMRFDGTKFVSLKLPSSKYVKGKNALQRCALDILNNQDITIAAVLGGYGSGKSFLTTKMALYSVNEKGWQSTILGVREVVGEGKEIGFLPGDLEAKVESFFKPIAQQLDGGEFELESLKQRGALEVNTPYFMKGTTYNNTIMLVDEAEDLTEKQVRLVGTRVGSNSRIFFNGDYKQSVIKANTENALVKMCNEFKGNPMFACIYLGEDVRSTTSKMFANLFNE